MLLLVKRFLRIFRSTNYMPRNSLTGPDFGRRLAAAREARGLSQSELAKRLEDGATPATISRWESGRFGPNRARLDKLVRNSAALLRLPAGLKRPRLVSAFAEDRLLSGEGPGDLLVERRRKILPRNPLRDDFPIRHPQFFDADEPHRFQIVPAFLFPVGPKLGASPLNLPQPPPRRSSFWCLVHVAWTPLQIGQPRPPPLHLPPRQGVDLPRAPLKGSHRVHPNRPAISQGPTPRHAPAGRSAGSRAPSPG